MEPSHVLVVMGLDRTAADESIRVSLGRGTTAEDTDSQRSGEIALAVGSIRAVDERQEAA